MAARQQRDRRRAHRRAPGARRRCCPLPLPCAAAAAPRRYGRRGSGRRARPARSRRAAPAGSRSPRRRPAPRSLRAGRRPHRARRGPSIRASGVDALPAQQEAQEIARGDRLDLGAQPLDGVAVDARQQPALAPFVRRRSRREAAAQGEAFGLERRERGARSRPARARADAASVSGVTGPWPSSRPRRISISASSRDQFALGMAAGRGDRGCEPRLRPQRLELRQPLGGDPERRVRPHRAASRAVPRELRRASRSSPAPLRLRPRSGIRARPAHRAARRHWRPRARLRRARARSPRDRAGRDRLRPPAPASAGSSPPGSGAPPAAHRRDRHRAAPTAPRAPAARAR